MKYFHFLRLALIGLLISPLFAAGPAEKTLRYHQVLLKRPGDSNLLSRLVLSWEDEETEGELLDWLKKRVEAEAAATADFRVLASFYESAGQDKEALEILSRAIKKQGEDPELRFARAETQAKLLNYEAALEDLKLVAGAAQLERKAATLKGTWLLRAGKTDEAVAAWKDSVEKFPEDEDFREDLIEILMVESLHEEAISGQQELIAMTRDPYQKALRQLRLAEIQLVAIKEDEGLATYEAVMAATAPGTWLEREVLSQVERFFLRVDDVQGLRDYYQKLREKHPRRVAIHKALALQMARNGELPEAVLLFREVLQITPGDLGNREQFIDFLDEFQKYEEARTELQALLELRSEDVNLWKRLVVLETTLKDEDGARTAILKISKLLPDEAASTGELARLYAEANLNEDADRTLREGIVQWPEADELVSDYAQRLIAQRKLVEAKEIWMGMARSGDREKLLRASRMMASHRMGKEAFAVLLNQISEFQEDALVLDQLCVAATNEEQAVAALPHALTLVRLAKGANDLENSIGRALTVILRAHRRSVVVKTLEELIQPTVNDLVLLSELHLAGGQGEKGRRVLNGLGDVPLGRLFQVRFEEKRGDFVKAIELLEKIIEAEDGRKPLLLRRLVQLHRSARNPEGALATVDEWRRIAPGDPQAWMMRVDLLLQLKRPLEAVRELRRMIAKLGPEDGRRAKLAYAQMSAGNLRAAQKSYEQLYNGANGLEEKLRWVRQWAQLALGQGRMEELVMEFERRSRKNPRSITPLLALATIHEEKSGGRQAREVLKEAVRRRPDDAELLIRIANFERGRGRNKTSREWLRKAVKIEQGARAKQMLANQLLKAGKLDECLSLLEIIPAEGGDPRRIEKMVEDLISLGQRQKGIDYLDRLLPRHHDDWRLVYLRAILHKQSGEFSEAAARFVELESAKGDLPGFPTPKKLDVATALPDSWPVETRYLATLWVKMTGGRFDFIDVENQQPHLVRDLKRSLNNLPMFTLPKSVVEARQRALLQQFILHQLDLNQERRESGTEKLLAGIPEDFRVMILSELDPSRLRGELLKLLGEGSGEVYHAAMWLKLSEKGEPREMEVLEIAMKMLLKDRPGDLIKMLAEPEGSRGVSHGRMLELSRLAFAALDQEERGGILNRIRQIGWQFEKGSDEAIAFKNNFIQWLVETEPLQGAPDLVGLEEMIHEMIAKGDSLTGAKLLNLWIKKGTMRLSTVRRGRRLRAQTGLEPEVRDRNIVNFCRRYRDLSTSGQEMEDVRRRDIYRQLGVDEAEAAKPSLEPLLPHLGEVENVIARGMLLHVQGKDAEVDQVVETLAASKNPEEVIFVSGVHRARGELKKSYEALKILVSGDLKNPLVIQANEYLVSVALDLLEEGTSPDQLEEARTALGQLWRVIDSDDLQSALGKFGWDSDPAINYSIAGKSGTATRARSRTRYVPRPTQRVNPKRHRLNLVYRAADEAPTIDAALREIRFSDYYRPDYGNKVNDLIRFLMRKNLEKPFLARLKPGAGAEVEEFIRYAKIAHDLDQRVVELEAWNEVLVRMPNHQVGKLGKFTASQAEVRDWSLFSMKKSGDAAEGNVRAYFEYFLPDLEADFRLAMLACEIVTHYLEEATDEVKGTTRLSWIGSFLKKIAGTGEIEGLALKAIGTQYSGWRSSSPAHAASEERRNLVWKLCQAMIGVRGTSDQAMKLIADDFQRRQVLKLTSEEVRSMAEQSVRLYYSSPLKNLGEAKVGAWVTSRQENERAAGVEFLVQFQFENEKVPVFSDELWKLQEETRATDYAVFKAAERGDIEGLLTALPDDGEQRWDRLILAAYILGTEKRFPEDEKFSGEFIRALFARKEVYGAKIASRWAALAFSKRGEEGLAKWLDSLASEALGGRNHQELLLKLGQEKMPQIFKARYGILEIYLGTLSRHYGYPLIKWLGDSGLEPLFNKLADEHFEEVVKQLELKGSEWFEGNGLMKSPPDSARVLYVMNCLWSLSEKKKEPIRAVGEEVRNDENFDPLLRELIPFLLDTENEFGAVIGGYPKVLQELEEKDQSRTLEMLRRLFKEIDHVDIPDAPRQSLERLYEKERKWATMALQDFANKDGGILGVDDQRDFWELVVWVSAHEPQQAVEWIEKIVATNVDAGTKLVPPTVRFSMPSLTKTDRWVREALSPMLQDSSRTTHASTLKVINRLMRGKLEPNLSASWDGILMHEDYFLKHFEVLLAEVAVHENRANRAEVLVDVLRPFLKELTPEERQTMAILYLPHFADFLGGHSEDYRAEVTWLDEEFRKEFPGLADCFCALRLSFAVSRKDRSGAKEVSDYWLAWLSQAGLNAPLAMDAASRLIVIDRLRRTLETEELWKWIVGALRTYHARMPDQFTPLKIQSLDLKAAEIGRMGVASGPFIDLARQVVALDASGYSYDRLILSITRELLPIAIEKKMGDAVHRFVKVDPRSSRGNLDRMVEFAEAGQLKIMKDLLPDDGRFYKHTEELVFSKGLQKKVSAILNAIPEETRYRAEVALAALPDAEGDAAPMIPREERLEKLAGQFMTKGPIERMARLEMLANLAHSQSAFSLVEKEVRELEEQMSWASAHGYKKNRSQAERERELILNVISRDLERRSYESFRRHFRSFHNIQIKNRWEQEYGLGVLSEIFINHCFEQLEESENLTTTAAEFLKECRFVHLQLLTSQRTEKNYLIRQSAGLSLLFHILGQKSLEWQEWIAGLSVDEQKAHRSAVGRFVPLNLITGLNLARREFWKPELKKKVVEALLVDQFIQKGLPEDDPKVIGFLVEKGVISQEALNGMIDALPVETPALPLYLWQRGLEESDPAASLVILKKAHRFAVERKSQGAGDMLLAIVRNHLALDQKTEAAALLKTIDRSGMNKAERIRIGELEESLNVKDAE